MPDSTPQRDLSALFDPASVAVIGASDDSAKWGYGVSRQLLAAGAARPVYLVNRRGATVLGRRTYRQLTEVHGPVDLVAICVPSDGFLAAVTDALAVGARAIVAITAGLAESGEAGRAIEEQAVARVRAAGAVMIGPNCLGVVDTTTALHLASDPVTPGRVAILSQSGNLTIDLDALLAERGLGVSRFVSLGNQADVTLAELIRSCAAHESTAAIAVYAEDLRDGRAFARAARVAHAAGKAVVLLAPGRSAAASRGAASHTGALTSPARVVDAVCAAGGVHRVETPAAMADLLLALDQPRRARGLRTAVLTDGGGHGAIAADVASATGLEVAALSAGLGARLRAALWEPSPVTNPVDLAGIGEQDPSSYGRGLGELLASDEVDAVLMTGYFGGYSTEDGSLGPRELLAAADLVARVRAQDKPVIVHSIFPGSPSCQVLSSGGVPVYRDVAAAVTALRGLLVLLPGDDELALPAPAEPLTQWDYPVIRAAMGAAGVMFPGAGLAATESAALAVAEDLGYPVALKAMGLLHKSDSGGVVLDVADRDELLVAWRGLADRLAPATVSVEQMADLAAGVEVIVGVHQDPRCGPVLMVGLGGVFTEVLADVAFALAPVSETTATHLLRSLQGAPLLTGVRGRTAVDLAALARTVAVVSAFAATHPELSDLEVNPVLATDLGAVALDARALGARAVGAQAPASLAAGRTDSADEGPTGPPPREMTRGRGTSP